MSLPKAKLEAEFVQMLTRLRVTDLAVGAFPKIAARVWEQKQGNAKNEVLKITGQLEEFKAQKGELIMMRTRGKLTREEFDQANRDLGTKTVELEEKQQIYISKAATVSSFVAFAQLHLMDIAKAWQIAQPEQRRSVPATEHRCF